MERVQREKDVFIRMAQQLPSEALVKLKPLVETIHYKLDVYAATRDVNTLDSLYYLLNDAVRMMERYKKHSKALSSIRE
jgi:hypothetical protein